MFMYKYPGYVYIVPKPGVSILNIFPYQDIRSNNHGITVHHCHRSIADGYDKPCPQNPNYLNNYNPKHNGRSTDFIHPVNEFILNYVVHDSAICLL